MHGYYNASGSQLGCEESTDVKNGGRHFELMAVGLPPYDDEPYSENKFRTAWGCALRLKYP
jgi:hypothetical protein